MQAERVEAPGAEWDAFVEATPGATLAHAAAWAEVLQAAYGLEPVYLAARGGGGELQGVLPLFRFRTLAGRLELVSVPFHDSGGILAREPRAQEALLEAALALARRDGAAQLELRQRTPLATLHGEPPRQDRVDLYLPLEADEQAQWGAIPAKARNQTRKATREGLRLAGPDVDLASAFYAPFSVNMRDLGSPPHALAFYRTAARRFGERLRFVVACDGARPVAGLVAIHFAGAVTVPWAASLRSERARCPNNLVYWEALRWAVEVRAREFDFGRSPRNSGTHRFKRGWGARERPLAWVRFDAHGRPGPPAAPGGHRVLRALSGLWRRLPVTLSRRLGPRIRRRIAS